MASSRLINVRLDESTRDRWEQAARSGGLPLGTFIKRAVEQAIADGAVTVPSSTVVVHAPPPELGGKVFKGPDPKGGKR